ncbi:MULTISPECIES: hypothetical protein [Bacillus cereus group]|uniref:hypothetical protein n=1 Tax=Bacillus cereus group TaxID=86661 RepID=UPI00124BEE4F|nr:hypothetical protein [Bacillus cereus]KAB2422543.1 hypothetical protein F8167_14450 [Bacillus cereus]
MAQIDTGQQIFSKPNGVISWNETKGQKLVNTISIDENKRGIHREWGFIGETGISIDNLLKKWADFEFFLKVSVEANVGIRGQTPLNLFDGKEQAGLALQLQAIARAAIAIGLEIDLTIGELMEELQIHSDADEFLNELLKIILSETKIEGVMYAQAAIAVMAYAHLIITGSFFSNEQNEDGPGFNMISDGGYGFIAGGGYRCYIQANMATPGKLIYRASDLAVTECMKKVSPFSEIRIMEAPLKMGLRLAYLLGENLRKNFIVGDPRINQTTVIIIEEGQRWFLHQFNKFAKENIQSIIKSTGISTHSTYELLNKLNDRAISIDEMKSNLGEIIRLTFEISPSLPPAYQEIWLKQICIIWASMNLYTTVTEQQLKETIEYYSFQGPIEVPNPISTEIKKHLANPPSGSLHIEHLITFLFENTLSTLLEQQSDISYVIDIYKTIFPGTNQEVLQHLFNFIPSNASTPDKPTLAKLYNGLNTFYQTHMAQIDELLEREITANTELLYVLKHSILPSLALLLDVVIPEMLNGFQSGEDKKKTMIEALSSTLLPLVGRTLIQIQDGILSKTKDQLGDKLRQAGKELEHINLSQKFKDYDWEKYIKFNFPDYLQGFLSFLIEMHKDLFQEYLNLLINIMILPMQKALEVMAEIIEEHPYPKSVFNDMEAILTPINNWKNTIDFYRNLTNDPKWLPQRTKVENLLKDLGKYMLIDMQKYNTQLISILLNAMLTKLLEDIEFVINFIQKLLNTLLNLISGELANKSIGPLVNFIEKRVGNEIYKYGIPSNYIKDAIDLLRAEINKGVIDNIIPSITGALTKEALDAKTIINALRGQELNPILFREVIIEQIKNHLLEKLDDTLGFNVKFSVPIEDIGGTIGGTIDDIGGGLYSHSHHSYGTSIPINLGFISFSSIDIIDIVINELLNNSLIDEQYKKLSFEPFIKFVYLLEEKPPIHEKKIPEIEKQYIEFTRSFPVIINIKDMLLIVQPHKEHTDHMEILIHFPDNNVRTDNVIIRLNEIEISLDCFSFYNDTPFFNRQNSVLLYGVAPFYKLKSNINTLHVFYQDMESKLSFSIE